MLKTSIIIPYFNQKEHLLKTLHALSNQTVLKSSYEIIVCDDGSYLPIEPLEGVCVLSLKKQGAASARNQGINVAKGEIVIFLDADMVVEKDFIEKHQAFHATHKNSCAIGLRLHQNIEGTYQTSDVRERLLKYLNKNFSEIKSPWFLAYTCHISIPLNLIKNQLFDPHFIHWGLEDIEWAYRIFKTGITFHLIEDCKALHLYHNRIIDDQKFEGWLQNLNYTIKKHPSIHPLKMFIPVFDPKIKDDYFLTYSNFEKNL